MSLFYGIQCKANAVVCGAPQYHIGTYLNTDNHRLILQAMVGSTGAVGIKQLDDIIKNVMIEYAGLSRTKVYLHYSPYEHTYEEQIKDMVRDLKQLGYVVEEDNLYTYKEHSDVGSYFVPYLKAICKRHLYGEEEIE